VGGGNSALEESLYLAKIVGKLYLIHRRDEFRGNRIYQDKLAALGDKIEILRSSVVTMLHGDKELTGLTVKELKTGEERKLSVDGLFVYVGYEPSTEFLPAEVERDGQGFIITDTEMRTNIPGIFAAGDIRSKLCRQVITAAGDGATAAQAAFVFLEQLHA
jgi:Thioredoxin reductase